MTATNALCGGQISGHVRTVSKNDPNGWIMPSKAIIYRKSPGPTLRRQGKIPRYGQGIQVEWYGKNDLDAEQLFETWASDFFPKNPAVAQGFIVADCSVESIEEMSAPALRTDPDTAWPRMIGIYFVRWGERYG